LSQLLSNNFNRLTLDGDEIIDFGKDKSLRVGKLGKVFNLSNKLIETAPPSAPVIEGIFPT
jgi:hypothetical protein